MSSFRFNFGGDSNQQKEHNQELSWLESEEVVPNKQINNLDNVASQAKMFTCGDVEIGHLIISEVLFTMCESNSNNPTALAEKVHSDLVTGKYEGGLKIWECTYDLIEYLIENKINFKDLKVLDLGCGAGILGIYAFLCGSLVTFQDYNKEILECVTIPNVLLNIEDSAQREPEIAKCKFYSGDWRSFNRKLKDSDAYDIILTSETIYNEDNYDKLIEIFSNRLNKNGTIYVAAKVHYFGVGGGVRQFQSKINNYKFLCDEICWKSSGGIQREILKIKHKILYIHPFIYILIILYISVVEDLIYLHCKIAQGESLSKTHPSSP